MIRPSVVRRTSPLPIAGALGVGRVASALATRLIERGHDGLDAVVGEGVMLVVGDETAIPWVDGLIWLGRPPQAPSLLLPTQVDFDCHLGLIAAAIGEPAAMVPECELVVPLAGLAPISHRALVAWLGAS